MAVQKPVLGKGLASLLSNAASAPVSTPASLSTKGTGATAAGDAMPALQPEMANKDRHPGIAFANVDDIIANQYQPRRDFDDPSLQELAQSIRSNGIIQPLIVRKGPNGYQLIAGERRLRASKLAGLKQVPIVIRKSTDREALELALIENIQRQNLNCIDEALAYFQLMQDFALTQEEIAVRVGKERSTITNYLRLLRLPEAIIDDLKRQILSFGHGKALLSLEDHELRLRARAQIVEQKLSVRESEALVDQYKRQAANGEGGVQAGASGAPAKPVQSRIATLSQNLTRHLSTKVEIRGTEKKGKIVLHYGSREELERILGVMQN
ncbi:MAG: ParB/RepB/Spo0J family partition protein [Methylotenera sp.]|nr:ParB/RepB/Spo0J family partition protein [Oligoflexia bacterium]